jgi:hypothetical protein
MTCIGITLARLKKLKRLCWRLLRCGSFPAAPRFLPERFKKFSHFVRPVLAQSSY